MTNTLNRKGRSWDGFPRGGTLSGDSSAFDRAVQDHELDDRELAAVRLGKLERSIAAPYSVRTHISQTRFPGIAIRGVARSSDRRSWRGEQECSTRRRRPA